MDENCQEREQLQAIWNKYDEKFAQHQSLEEQNRMLLAQSASLGGGASSNSKQNVVSCLNQKASAADSEAKQVEKQLLRREIDMRAFLDQYVSKRSAYHKYQVLKVKVNQAN